MANGLNTSSGTTRTGASDTSLNDPNLSDASFSRQGVVNQAGAFEGQAGAFAQKSKAIGLNTISDALGQGAQIALDADEGFAKAQLEAAIRPKIEGFIKEQNPRQLVEEQRSIFSDVSNRLSQIEGGLAAAEDPAEEIARAAPEFKNIISTLKAGETQGIMTRGELELRVLKATREAIARRPGLAQELTAHAEQTLNLSGARQIKEFEDNIDELEAKRFEQGRTKLINEYVKEFGVDIDLLSPPLQQMQSRLIERTQEKEAFDAAQQSLELSKEEAAAQSQEFLQNRAASAVYGGFSDFKDKSLDLLSQARTPQEKINAITQIKNLSGTYEAQTIQILDRNGATGTAGAAHRDLSNRLRSEFISSLESNVNNEDLAAFAKNTAEFTINSQKQAVTEKFNLPLLDVQNKFMSSHAGAILAKSPAVVQDIQRFGMQLLEGGIGRGTLESGMRTTHIKEGVPDIVSILKGHLKVATPLPDEPQNVQDSKQPQIFDDMLTNAVNILIDNPHGLSSDDRFNATKNIVTEFSTTDVIPYLNNASSAVKEQLGNIYDQHRVVLAVQRDKLLEKAELAGASVTTKALPDGRLSFVVRHENPQTQREFSNRFNNGIGNRYNELVKATSLLFGEDIKTTADQLNNTMGNVQKRGIGIQSSVGSPEFLDKMIAVESAGVADAKNPNSSATGVAQFTEGTFLRVVGKFAPELAQGKTRQELLDLRKDPVISKQMAANLAEDNARILRSSDVDITDTNLYLAHFLGASSASELLTSTPTTPVEDLLGSRVIEANKSVLKGKQVRDVVHWAQLKMGER